MGRQQINQVRTKGKRIMNISDYLKEMEEAGAEFDSQSGAGIVGKIKIEFGFHMYVENHEFWEFWNVFGKPDEAQLAYSNTCKAITDIEGDVKGVRRGIKVTVYADVLSRDEPYSTDLSAFTPSWQEGAYQMITDSILENNMPLNDIFYGQVLYKANPYHVSLGEEGKTAEDQNGNSAYPTVRVPVRMFKSKLQATNFVTENDFYQDSQDEISTETQSNANEILADWEKSKMGECPYPDVPDYVKSFPTKPSKMTPIENAAYEILVKSWLIEIWDIPLSDLEKLLAEVVPI